MKDATHWFAPDRAATISAKGSRMTSRDLFSRLSALPPPAPDIEQAPPIELVAVLIGFNRRVRGWKQSVLADFSGVSLSTVERVERGEPVSPEALDKITIGLGLESGYFTAPRRPRTHAEMASGPIDGWPDLVVVDVAALRSQTQLRNLARCSAIVMLAPDVPEGDVQFLKDLAERVDFLGFILSAHLISANGTKEGGRRAAYQAVLDQIQIMRRAGYCVVAGVAMRTTPAGEERVALFSVSLRAKDPGALSRRKLFVDRRELTSTNRRELLD
jgi:hypothetical protein